MKNCPRCNGNVLEGYDEHLREWYPYCLQCGSRPSVITIKPAGPPKCSQGCGRPVMEIYRARVKAVIALSKCEQCRAKQNLQRRLAKRAEKRKEAA